MSKTTIGEFLAILRRSKGYTQQEVADKIGVSNKTVSGWETGISCPDISLLPVLADLYGVTCDEILRGERIVRDEAPRCSAEKREKAVRKLLETWRFQAHTALAIGAGIALCGVLLSLVLGCGLSMSRLAFLLSLPFFAGALFFCLLRTRYIRYKATSDDIESGETERFVREILRVRLACGFIVAGCFGFVFPHVFAFLSVYTKVGLMLPYAFLYGIPCAAAALLLFLFVRLIVLAVSPSCDKKTKTFAKFRIKNICAIFLPVAAVIAAAFLCISFLPDGHTPAPETYIFSDMQELTERAEQCTILEKYDHEVVSTETPAEGTETALYEVVYRFPDLSSVPEDFSSYSVRREGDDLLVTLRRLRVTLAEEDGQTTYDILLAAPEFQERAISFSVEYVNGQASYVLTSAAPSEANLYGLGMMIATPLSVCVAAGAVALYIVRRKKASKAL